VICLSELAGADIDMLTIVLVGSSRTHRTGGDPPRLYTPRGYCDRALP
jgi:precorrin-3B methylase